PRFVLHLATLQLGQQLSGELWDRLLLEQVHTRREILDALELVRVGEARRRQLRFRRVELVECIAWRARSGSAVPARKEEHRVILGFTTLRRVDDLLQRFAIVAERVELDLL